MKIPLVPVRKGEVTDKWLKLNTPPYLQKTADADVTQDPGYLPQDIYKENQQGKHPRIQNHTSSFLLTYFGAILNNSQKIQEA